MSDKLRVCLTNVNFKATICVALHPAFSSVRQGGGAEPKAAH
jgi:hypothetical protein